MDQIIQFILAFGAKYPAAMGVFMVIGVMRSIFKPIMVLLDSVAVATPGKGDDELLAKLRASKIYQSIAFAMDYIASIKLPGYDK